MNRPQSSSPPSALDAALPKTNDSPRDSDGRFVRLVVFGDDWGRHPSSAQHLVRHLLPRYPVLWVNTIGTRMPRPTLEDARRIVSKLRGWTWPGARGGPEWLAPRVIAPPMWPQFRARWQRRLNVRLVGGAVDRALGPRRQGERRVAIAAMPLCADLVGRLAVDRWVYYCADDLSEWPGLDGPLLRTMERRLIERADGLIAVSETLRRRLATLGRDDAVLLTHGVDLAHWRPADPLPAARGPHSVAAPEQSRLPDWWRSLSPPVLVFFGLVDRRLDFEWCRALAGQAAGSGTLALVGPHQAPDPRLRSLPGVVLPGPLPYADLPALAQAADVLVRPYQDAAVTRAMQPLKLKEFLATGKPVVVRDLPSTREWADAADVVSSVEQLTEAVRERLRSGVTAEQRRARERLKDESWELKAARFEASVLATLHADPRMGRRPGTHL